MFQHNLNKPGLRKLQSDTGLNSSNNQIAKRTNQVQANNEVKIWKQNQPNKSPIDVSRGVPKWFLCLLAFCFTIICLFLIYQLFSWIYAVVGVVVIYLLLAFSVKIFEIRAKWQVQTTVSKHEYLKVEKEIEGKIQMTKLQGLSKMDEINCQLEVAKMGHQRDLEKISTSANLESQRIVREPLTLRD